MKYPKSINDADVLQTEIKKLRIKKDWTEVINLLNITQIKTINPKNFYLAMKNKHTIINSHVFIYWLYKKKSDDSVSLIIKKQKNNKAHGYFLTLKVKDGINIHHILGRIEGWSGYSKEFYNSLKPMTTQEHKEAHASL